MEKIRDKKTEEEIKILRSSVHDHTIRKITNQMKKNLEGRRKTKSNKNIIYHSYFLGETVGFRYFFGN